MSRSLTDGNLARIAFSLTAWLLPLTAWAGAPADQNDRPYELQTTFGFGLAPGLAFMGKEATSSPLTVALTQTIRFPRYSQFGLELNFVAPGGLGATLLVDVIRAGPFRLHVLDPGVVWNLFGPVSVARVRRNVDLTLGAGIDLRLTREISLTVNWRMYFPEPIGTISRYGDFARPIYAEAAKGGQLCFGLTRVW